VINVYQNANLLACFFVLPHLWWCYYCWSPRSVVAQLEAGKKAWGMRRLICKTRPEPKKEKDWGVGNLLYRFFLQRVGHCISRKPLNKDYLHKGVGQLYLNKAGSAAMSSPLQEGSVHTWNISSKQLGDVENT